MTCPIRWIPLILLTFVLTAAPSKVVWGQAAPAAEDDDAALIPAEPDFALINLPTTLRLPKYRGNFRLTHRFHGNLRGESFGEQASNLFGLDNGAAIGFEFRYAVARHLQAAVYRTNVDRQTQFHFKYDGIAQRASIPLSVSLLASVEGANNFRRARSPALGGVISRRVGDTAALYATPVWVHHSTGVASDLRDTGFLGLGGRYRLHGNAYVLAEVSPRLGGYAPGDPEYSFGIESRVGGHVFQLNFSNTEGTTYAQIARGGAPSSLFLGFNLARKFY